MSDAAKLTDFLRQSQEAANRMTDIVKMSKEFLFSKGYRLLDDGTPDCLNWLPPPGAYIQGDFAELERLIVEKYPEVQQHYRVTPRPKD